MHNHDKNKDVHSWLAIEHSDFNTYTLDLNCVSMHLDFTVKRHADIHSDMPSSAML